MQRVNFRRLLLGSFALSLLWTSAASADFYLHSWENHRAPKKRTFRLTFNVGFYSTSNNFDPNSAATGIANLDSYSRMPIDVELEYGLSNRFTTFARLNWSRAAVSLTGTGTATNFGFGDQTFGVNYRLLKTSGKISVDLQGQIDFPLYSDPSTAKPLMGDGTKDFTAGAFATVPVLNGEKSRAYVRAGVGYTLRSGGFSSAIPWSVTAKWWMRGIKRIGADLSVLGLTSLSTDKAVFAIDPTWAGNSSFINAQNPSLIQGRVRLTYRATKKLSVRGAFQMPFMGTNAPKGTFFALSGIYRFGPSDDDPEEPVAKRTSGDPRKRIKRRVQDKSRGFHSYGITARVVRVNDRLSLVKVDKGSDAGVKPGMLFDIFSVRGGKLDQSIARAKVVSVKDGEAALKVIEYFREVWIEPGFQAKRLLE